MKISRVGSGRIMTREIRAMSRVGPPWPTTCFLLTRGSDRRIAVAEPAHLSPSVSFKTSFRARLQYHPLVRILPPVVAVWKRQKGAIVSACGGGVTPKLSRPSTAWMDVPSK